MERQPLTSPIVYVSTGILVLALGVTLLLFQIPNGNRISFLTLAALGLVVFSSLLVGIFSYWFFSLGSHLLQAPTEEPYDQLGSEKPDFSDLVFQPQSLIKWYEGNLSRYQDRCTSLERISQLLSFMDYSRELSKQLRVALHFGQELFPDFALLIFRSDGSRIHFEAGSKPQPGGGIKYLDRLDHLVEEAQEAIRDMIDLDRLAASGWKSFSLPLRHERSPSLASVLPLSLWNQIRGLIFLYPLHGKAISQDEQVFARLLNRQIALFLENHLLYQENLSQERLSNEVEIAKSVQSAALPKASPVFPSYDIFGVCNPSREISGDYFDLILRPDGTMVAVIADVSGKGLPAALFLARVQALVRAIADEITGPSKLLTFLSHHLCKENIGTLFATMVVAFIRPDDPKVFFASAGHGKPLIFRKKNGFVEEPAGQVGIPLGLFDTPEEEYQDLPIDLMPQDGIMLYTDGLTDATNHNRDRYGIERVKLSLEKATGQKASEIVFCIMNDLNHFKGTAPLEDDTTILFLKLDPIRND